MLFSIIAHEYAHGYAALKQGDTTALALGRLTWNPLKHIDPILTIVLPLALAAMNQPIIGGAKPVPSIRGITGTCAAAAHHRVARRVTTNVIIAVCATAAAALLGLLGRWIPAPARVRGSAGDDAVRYLAQLPSRRLQSPADSTARRVARREVSLPAAWAIQYQRIGFAGSSFSSC